MTLADLGITNPIACLLVIVGLFAAAAAVGMLAGIAFSRDADER